MPRLRSRVLFLSCSVLIYFLGYQHELLVSDSEALLSFPRQEIATGSNDGLEVNGTSGMQTRATYKGPLDNSTDIQRITYNSDGDSECYIVVKWAYSFEASSV